MKVEPFLPRVVVRTGALAGIATRRTAMARTSLSRISVARLAVLSLGVVSLVVLSGCAMAMLSGAASAGGSGASQGSRSASRIAADDAITTSVRSKLVANPGLKGLNLRVDTHDGIVTLRGQVAKVEQRNAAQLDARAVEGVKAVQNLLTVR